MRCPKCGTINFDCLEKCPKCGHDFEEISRKLGKFIRPDPDLNWFSINSQEASAELTEDSTPAKSGTDLREFDLNKLGAVAKDSKFQEALDQVLKE